MADYMDEEFENEGQGELIDLSQWDEEYVNAPVEERDFDSVPDGKYQVIVDKVALTKSQTSGNPMLKWKLKVLGPKHEGAIIWRNNIIASKNNVQWLKNDLHVCGLDLEKLSDLRSNLEKLLNVMLEVTKRTKGDNENVYFNRRIINDAAGGDIDKQLQEEAARVF
ncbi:MAG: hypothetical protein BWY28_01906 [bacterium ADurb.Bin236]|nr:MAG: hypothetical protein BWY28_01906 [bacterium ADurb.Bin236]